MRRTQIYITEQQHKALRRVAKATNRAQGAIVREALDKHLGSKELVPEWKEALRALCGIWADRPEIEQEMLEVRKSWDRNPFAQRK